MCEYEIVNMTKSLSRAKEKKRFILAIVLRKYYV